MQYMRIKIAAGILCMGLIFTGNELKTEAAKASDQLPAAGLGLSLKEGVSLKSVADTVQDNEITRKIVEPKEEEVTEEKTSAAEAAIAVEEAAESEFSDLVIAQVNDYVNVRDKAGEDGNIVGKLYDDSVGTYLGEENGWYRIQSGNCTGYVKAEYCVTGKEAEALVEEVGTRIATVTTTTLNVREAANTDSRILEQLPIEEELIVLEESDGWVRVKVEEASGYVSTEFVSLRTDFVHAESKEEEEARLREEARRREEALEAARRAEEAARAQTESVTEAAAETAAAEAAVSGNGAAEPAPAPAPVSSEENYGQQVADYAMQFLGNPYVYGGTSLTNGADCSGFVMSVYAHFGVSLPHSSAADRKMGYDAGGIANAQAGDLVCYSGHVGIYIGGGQIVHASSSRTGIIVSNADYDTILTVRRIF
ncbi:MAG: SH3 domain-containing protein [Lachnospiraceae bacterium]|nr:SH3 domain-containing protein [Lachnospiraceae bacterium]